jgi:phospholipid/cholesterol/gamma-HCH transport system substrate-binding protein
LATRTQKIRLGLFAVASAAVLAVLLVVFAGLKFWDRPDTYYVVMERSALGLDEGSRVTYQGIRVGSVRALDILPDDPGRIRITIAVDEGTAIRADARAYLTYAGITGLKIIDLRGGSREAPQLEPGDTIPIADSTLDKLQDKAAIMADQMSETMERVDQVLEHLIAITEPSQFEGLDEIVAQAQLTSRNLAAASGDLRALVRENRAALRESIGSVTDAARQLSDTLEHRVDALADSAGVLVEDVRAVVRRNRGQIEIAMRDLRQASRSVKDLTRDLRQRPSRLLFSRPPKERKLP